MIKEQSDAVGQVHLLEFVYCIRDGVQSWKWEVSDIL